MLRHKTKKMPFLLMGNTVITRLVQRLLFTQASFCMAKGGSGKKKSQDKTRSKVSYNYIQIGRAKLRHRSEHKSKCNNTNSEAVNNLA